MFIERKYPRFKRRSMIDILTMVSFIERSVIVRRVSHTRKSAAIQGFIEQQHVSLVMRKPEFCICENKDADQLRGNRESDQRLCFRFTDSTIPLLSKSEIKPLAIFCRSTAWFVSDLVGNPEDRFSHNEAHV